MKRFTAVAIMAITVLFATQVSAGEWGWLSTMPNDEPGASQFRVNIETVDGQTPVEGANVAVKPGSHEVKTSLVFSAAWGDSMDMTEGNVYYQTINVDVEAGKTYYLASKVDLKASPEAQNDGSFWTAFVAKTEP
jgi:hypothetical protein